MRPWEWVSLGPWHSRGNDGSKMTVGVANVFHFIPFLMPPAEKPQAKPPLLRDGPLLWK